MTNQNSGLELEVTAGIEAGVLTVNLRLGEAKATLTSPTGRGMLVDADLLIAHFEDATRAALLELVNSVRGRRQAASGE